MHQPIDPVSRLNDIDICGFRLTEFRQPALMRTPKHSHEYTTIFMTLGGCGRDNLIGREFDCRPNSILVRPAGVDHTHDYGREGIHGLVIEVKPDRLENIRSISRVLDQVGSYQDIFLNSLVTRTVLESRIMDSASELAIEGLALELLAHLARRESGPPASGKLPLWLDQAVEFIRGHFAEPIPLAQIAAQVGVHSAHLSEVFRRHHGCSIGEYVRRLRLDQAAGQVMWSKAPLAEISANAGFYDQSHFTKLFKRHTGLAPGEMRAIMGKPPVNTRKPRFVQD
ncbi:MAG: AraC family transcriptional regulator [Pyrinomonadaceae bacterium]